MTPRASTSSDLPRDVPLVDERQVGPQVLAVSLGDLHPTRVRRHDHDVAAALVLDVVEQHGHGGQVIDRLVEESLDLSGVQIHAQHAARAGGNEQIGDQLRRDRLPAFGLAILPGVAVERADRRDALGRGPLRGVDHDQVLHDRVVHRVAVGLDDEDVGATDVLAEPAVGLAVREVADVGLAQRYTRDGRRCPPPALDASVPHRDASSSW